MDCRTPFLTNFFGVFKVFFSPAFVNYFVRSAVLLGWLFYYVDEKDCALCYVRSCLTVACVWPLHLAWLTNSDVCRE